MKKMMDLCKELGLKQTPQRLAILNLIIDKPGTHLSAEDIFSKVKEDFPTISQATVYNTLDVLTKKGRLVEITINPRKKHYESNLNPHHHVICTSCGKIGDVWDEELINNLPASDVGDFEIQGWHINFSGICKECGLKEGNSYKILS